MAESNPMAPKALSDPGETATPEDVATLYSWANLHGAKYRDFSASRAQAREEARLRVEEAQAEQRRREAEVAERRAQEEAQIAARLAAEAAEAARQAEADRLAEIARQAEAERQAVLAAQEAQRQAAQQRAWQPQVAAEAQPAEFASPFDFGDAAAGFDPEPAAQAIPDRTSPLSSGYPTPFPDAEPAAARFTPEPPTSPFTSRQAPAPAFQRGSFQPSAVQNPAPPPATMYTTPATSYRSYGDAQPAPDPYQASYSEQHYSGAAAEPYSPSPWLPPDLHLREAREVATGPAWLAPQLPVHPAAAAPVAGTQQPTQRSTPSVNFSQPAPRAPEVAQAPGQSAGQVPGSAVQYPQYPSQYAAPSRGPAPAPVPSYMQPPAAQHGSQLPVPGSAVVEDTLLGSRDRIASRWYALKGVFDPHGAPVEQAPASPPAQVPVLAVFSLAGGVGKTSLVASLGRALSSRGERVLLVDTAAYGLLPFFFGARDQRPGQLRTFNPPGVSGDAPIQLITFDPESQEHAGKAADAQAASQGYTAQDWLAQEVGRHARGVNRVLIDLPTASGATTRRVLRMAPVVLVPVLPDMNSVVSVGAIEGFFRSNTGIAPGGRQGLPYYLLNQFDYSLPLHLDVREILREQIGDRLIPFALRRSPSVSEALAEGMTVMDYAPNAVVAEDYANLAGWVRSIAAPAAQSYRGVRWSER